MSRVEGKAYCTYVLWSEGFHRFYVGMSEDPEARLRQHNDGLSRWTARYRPWTLVLTERHIDYSTARKREIQLKRQKSGQGFFQMTGLDAGRFSRLGRSSLGS